MLGLAELAEYLSRDLGFLVIYLIIFVIYCGSVLSVIFGCLRETVNFTNEVK